MSQKKLAIFSLVPISFLVAFGVFASSAISINSGNSVALGAGSQIVTSCDSDVNVDPPGLTLDPLSGKLMITTISVSNVSQKSPNGCGNWIMELAASSPSGTQITSWSIPSSSIDTPFYFGASNSGTHMAKSSLTPIDPTQLTTIALQMYPGTSCADGGPCSVGDTGPGGGVVIYVSSTPITLQGAGKSVTRIEMAPNGWGGVTYPADPALQLCEPYGGGGPIWTGSKPPTWPGYANVSLPTGLGYGLSNTNKLLTFNTSGVSCALSTQAASVARSYTGGGLNDWFLPSADELNLVCRYANSLDMSSNATCTAGTVRPGFISTVRAYWWSSTMITDQQNQIIQIRGTGTGSQTPNTQSANNSVRPIRMF
jgi:hypothetical protein